MAKLTMKGFGSIVETNFLLTCSDNVLAQYELARLDEIADLRAQLHEILFRLEDLGVQAIAARWFRNADRQALKEALEADIDPVAIARERAHARPKRKRDRGGPERSALIGPACQSPNCSPDLPEAEHC
jgi:hypothetical protein